MITTEYLIANEITSGSGSLLLADTYKFTMAGMGFPYAEETFYYSFRHGGPWYNPFDLEEFVKAFVRKRFDTEEERFLVNSLIPVSNLDLLLQPSYEIFTIKKDTWFGANEPIITLTGKSFFVSWIEDLITSLNFPLQIATQIKFGVTDFNVSTLSEKEIVSLVAELMKVNVNVQLCEDDFINKVHKNCEEVMDSVSDPSMIIEGGFRSMISIDHHREVLETCKTKGLSKTSNTYLAHRLFMRPSGTVGHEHQQRWLSDDAAFKAVRTSSSILPVYLVDTYDTNSGIDVAFQHINKDPSRQQFIRLDSGNHKDQLDIIMNRLSTDSVGANLGVIFADGYTGKKIRDIENYIRLRKYELNRFYVVGGFLVGDPLLTPSTRNKVAAVYKLSMSDGIPVMKFTKYKNSYPGKPVLTIKGNISKISQLEELNDDGFDSDGFERLSSHHPNQDYILVLSNLTHKLVQECSSRLGKVEE